MGGMAQWVFRITRALLQISRYCVGTAAVLTKKTVDETPFDSDGKIRYISVGLH